jgi:hypothetical protein
MTLSEGEVLLAFPDLKSICFNKTFNNAVLTLASQKLLKPCY